MNTRSDIYDIPPLYSVWLPIALLIPIAVSWNFDEKFYNQWVGGELGAIELLTPVVLIVGIVLGYKAYSSRQILNDNARRWVLLVVLACVYFAGEELSWGQQIFKWQTPEIMESLNDQGETNLHNMSSWFDQKPRLLLELFVLIGGVVAPISRKINGIELNKNSFFYWFWPSYSCMFPAILVILVKLPERLEDFFGISILELGDRHSEVQELYFAIFLSVYLASIYFRSRQAQ